MLAATISDRSLFSIFVLRSAVAIARKQMSSRAANTHQQHVRIWSQNSRGNSFSLNTGCSGEPTSATMRTVSTAKKIDMHANRAPRLRSGMSFKRAASATIVIAKTKDRSIEFMVMGSGLRWQLSAMECFGRCPLPFMSRTRRAAPWTASTHRTDRRAKQSNQITPTLIAGVATGNGFSLLASDHHILGVPVFHGTAKFSGRGRPAALG